MIIYVDIDNTVLDTKGTDYAGAKPMPERIEAINSLYNNGNTIIYWTARGTESGIDWKAITEEQFKKFGIKYSSLKFNKPIYDLFIDDKNINSEEFFK
jgi:dTDP-glucose 4,6-dehydratase